MDPCNTCWTNGLNRKQSKPKQSVVELMWGLILYVAIYIYTIYILLLYVAYLTHLCLVFNFWDIDQQSRPRSDATERGIWSGSTLLFWSKNKYKNENVYQLCEYKMTPSQFVVSIFCTQQAYNVRMTSCWRWRDVVTSHRRHWDAMCLLGICKHISADTIAFQSYSNRYMYLQNFFSVESFVLFLII